MRALGGALVAALILARLGQGPAAWFAAGLLAGASLPVYVVPWLRRREPREHWRRPW